MVWKAATDRVIIKCEPKTGEQKTTGGIVIPDRVKSAFNRGEVIAAGPNATNVLPGDIAIFEAKYAREIEKDIFSIDATGILALNRAE